MFICPVCREELFLIGKSYKCSNNHCYDIAKEGYINLLMSQKNSQIAHGDPKESVLSRREFLEGGYYQNLSDHLNAIIEKLQPKRVLDAGCGTGYYLTRLVEHLPDLEYYAIDIGKIEVGLTTKRNKNVFGAVCSLFHLPIKDQGIDLIMSVFCPYAPEEFTRVLADNGYVVSVQPGKNHLLELKEAVYDTPYLNADKGYDLPGFKLISSEHLVNKVVLPDNKTIMALWSMTPYAFKTSKKDIAKLEALSSLELTTDFLIGVYQKEQ